MSVEENKAISSRTMLEVWNRGDLALIDQIISPDFVGHNPGNLTVQGREAFKQFVGMYRAAFPDLRFSVEDQIAEGDKVVTRWSATGTHQGELMGIPATGKQSTVGGINIDRFEGGQLAESWTEWDGLGMMQQLGLAPGPGGAGG